MAKVRDIIRGAYSNLALLSAGEELDADRAASGLAAYNDLLASWAIYGVGGPAPIPQTLNDMFPFDARHVQAAKALLAERISAASGVDAPPTVTREAKRGWDALLTQYTHSPQAEIDKPLVRSPSQRFV